MELQDSGQINGPGGLSKLMIISIITSLKDSLIAMESEEELRSVPATMARLEQDLEVSTSDRDAAQAVKGGLRDAKAANTRRAYKSAWHMFFEWTILTGRPAMPAAPQTVALYLGHLAAEGKSLATINQARAAISHAHASEGISQTGNPARHPVVAEAIKGWRNVAPAPQQADALTAEALARIRETARLPRRSRGGGGQSAAGAQARGAVDLVLQSQIRLAPFVMATPGSCLVAPSPPRPVQDEIRRLVLCPYEAGQQPVHLGHCHGNQFFIRTVAAPFSPCSKA